MRHHVALTLATLLLAGAAQAESLKLVTEEYPPFSFRENGAIKGISVDQLTRIMKETGTQYSIELMPWARAIGLAEVERATCVFTTVHNEARNARFKWVEPLNKGRTLLVRKAGAPIEPKSIDEAKAFTIGTQRGDFTADILAKDGFQRVDLAASLDLTMKKLMSGRIDLMPLSEQYFLKLKHAGAALERVLTLAESTYSLACNIHVPDALIARLQESLDRLIADGTQARIFEQYGLELD